MTLTRALLLSFALITATLLRADEHSMAGPVALPTDVKSVGTGHALAGAWTGLSETNLPVVLIVEQAAADGALQIGIGVADTPWQRAAGHWHEDTFAMRLGDTDWRGYIAESGTLRLRADHGFQTFELSQTSLDAIRDPGWKDDFHGAEEFQIPGPAEVDGAATWLTTLLYHPPGMGPFPLAVLLHGATDSGGGKDKDLIWTHRTLAEMLTSRGFIVAVPQRRGRGQSTGHYGEGLATPPEQGYSCNMAHALAGHMRAMADIDAAMRGLRTRLDVDVNAPALLIGNSRGGALAHAWAGQNPARVSAVVSFAAGWVPESCPNSLEINAAALQSGTGFSGPDLWIYGSGDTLYGEPHTRALFEATRHGEDRYVMADLPWKNGGHQIIALPALYEAELSDFLDELAASGR